MQKEVELHGYLGMQGCLEFGEMPLRKPQDWEKAYVLLNVWLQKTTWPKRSGETGNGDWAQEQFEAPEKQRVLDKDKEDTKKKKMPCGMWDLSCQTRDGT